MTELYILRSIIIFLLEVSSGTYTYEGLKTMPLTKKGKTIKKELQKEYGKKKGESILYAMEKKGTAKGITKKTAKKKTSKRK
jgi:hypothetical protein